MKKKVKEVYNAEEKDYRLRNKTTRGRKFNRQNGTDRGKEVSKDCS